MREIEFIERFLGVKLKLHQKAFLKIIMIKNKIINKEPKEIQAIEYMLKELERRNC